MTSPSDAYSKVCEAVQVTFRFSVLALCALIIYVILVAVSPLIALIGFPVFFVREYKRFAAAKKMGRYNVITRY